MSSYVHDCCRCAGKMREGMHDFMARVVDEIIVIKDVPALICDTCKFKRDRCDNEGFFRRTIAGKTPGRRGDQIHAQACRLDCMSVFTLAK
jgi:YgiT-type zinc finger domain-containing protein